MTNETAQNEAKMIADYDQVNSTIFKYWSDLPPIEVKRMQNVVIPSLEMKGDLVSAALLKWAIATMNVRAIEEKNRTDEE